MKKTRILLWLSLSAIVIFLVINRGKLEQFGEVIKQAKPVVLPLMIGSQLLGYYFHARFYQSFLAIFGHKIETKRLFQSSLAINFVNQVFPSAGISGASYLASELEEVPAGQATLAQLMRYVFTFLSFLALLMAGFLMLFWGGGVTRLTVRVILLFLIVIMVAGLLIIVGATDRHVIERFALWLVGWLNGTARFLLRRRKHLITKEQVTKFFDDFYAGIRILVKHRGRWLKPLLYTLGINFAEVLTIYVVFMAFGSVVNPGVIIAGYSLAVAFSLVGFFTSGVGLYEATMVTAFVALGISFALAVSIVAVYRGLSFAIFMPIGFFYYRRKL